MFKIALVVLCGVLLVSAVGCQEGQKPTVEQPITNVEKPSDEPIWVTSPTRAFPDQADEVFFGVGMGEAKRLPGIYLRRRAATDRARNELAGQLETFVASVFKDYTEAAFTPSMDVAESQTLTSNVQKSIIATTLVGAKTVDMWKDPTTGDYYALVSLSMDSVAMQLKNKIAEVEKGKLRIAAEKAHNELDDIIAQKRSELNP